MRAIIFISAFISLAASSFAQDTTYNTVIRQLFKIDELDQRYRDQIEYVEAKYGKSSNEAEMIYKEMRVADSTNQSQILAILDKYGWLGYKEIGDQANTTIFMVIQHSGQAIQEKYLPMMREAVKNGKARAKSLALLEDRVALKQGRMQSYGSQLFWSKKMGKYIVLPLDDPDNVDKRRATVGLPPMSEYVSFANIKWDIEEYKKELPQILSEYRINFPNCCSKF